MEMITGVANPIPTHFHRVLSPHATAKNPPTATRAPEIKKYFQVNSGSGVLERLVTILWSRKASAPSVPMQPNINLDKDQSMSI